MVRTETRIALAAVGWFLLVAAAGALVLILFPAIPARIDGGGYLSGVVGRSLESPAQGLLLAGFLALAPHSLWMLRRRPDPAVADAYEAFGLWAQTLFTALGFMGTIVGVSLAIGGLREAMMAQDPGPLIVGLSTAFDTTFIGLAAAILVMAVRKAVRLWAAG